MRYATKRIKKNPYRNFSPQWESGQRLIKTQQIFNLDISRANFNTNLGHYPLNLALSSIMSDEMMTEITSNWYQWKLYSMTVGIKFLDSRNFYKTTNAGVALTNILWAPTGGQEQLTMYGGFFKNGVQKSAVLNVDPDTSASACSSLLETNCYKALSVNKRPIYFKWYNSKAYSGVYTNIPIVTIGSLISDIFPGSMPDNNSPHGIDIMITNRDRLQANTTTEEAKIRIQVCSYAVLAVKAKKVVDY